MKLFYKMIIPHKEENLVMENYMRRIFPPFLFNKIGAYTNAMVIMPKMHM